MSIGISITVRLDILSTSNLKNGICNIGIGKMDELF